MRQRPPEKNRQPIDGEPETLSEIVFPLALAREYFHDLEEFRVQYENSHGKTDITRRFTSTLPVAHQRWLLTHEPKIWFEGLPEFIQAYLKTNMQLAARDGNLDDTPTELMQLFVSGQMNLRA